MLLKIENLVKSYSHPDSGKKRTVLNDVSLEMHQGDTVSILGPSGSGKSTLLNMVGALDKPDSGTIQFDHKNITQLTGTSLNHFRNREVGFIFQFHHLLPQCTVLENVLLPVLPVRDKEYRQRSKKRALGLIERVGLEDLIHQFPNRLSGGECQRVAVIRALINSPKLLLADEPTGSLDSDNAIAIATLLSTLNKELNTALLVVTHSLELAAAMDTAYELRSGKLKAYKTVK